MTAVVLFAFVIASLGVGGIFSRTSTKMYDEPDRKDSPYHFMAGPTKWYEAVLFLLYLASFGVCYGFFFWASGWFTVAAILLCSFIAYAFHDPEGLSLLPGIGAVALFIHLIGIASEP